VLDMGRRHPRDRRGGHRQRAGPCCRAGGGW
jgi:hypothetical protein